MTRPRIRRPARTAPAVVAVAAAALLLAGCNPSIGSLEPRFQDRLYPSWAPWTCEEKGKTTRDGFYESRGDCTSDRGAGKRVIYRSTYTSRGNHNWGVAYEVVYFGSGSCTGHGNSRDHTWTVYRCS